MVTAVTIDLDRKLSPAYAGLRTVRQQGAGRSPQWEADTSYKDYLPPEVPNESDTQAGYKGRARKSDRLSVLSCAQEWLLNEVSPDKGDVEKSLLLVTGLPMGDQATESLSSPLDRVWQERPPKWDRWHELLELRAQRQLTLHEKAEYDQLAGIVAGLDAEEEAIAAPAVERLAGQHERVLASIDRLTEAVEAATRCA